MRQHTSRRLPRDTRRASPHGPPAGQRAKAREVTSLGPRSLGPLQPPRHPQTRTNARVHRRRAARYLPRPQGRTTRLPRGWLMSPGNSATTKKVRRVGRRYRKTLERGGIGRQGRLGRRLLRRVFSRGHLTRARGVILTRCPSRGWRGKLDAVSWDDLNAVWGVVPPRTNHLLSNWCYFLLHSDHRSCCRAVVYRATVFPNCNKSS
jgi:hypothetical protein